MDRLEFILHLLPGGDELEPIANDVVAIAIRREIEAFAQQFSTRIPAIETYMIATKVVSA